MTRAAVTATLVAVPVAVLAWLGLFWWSGGFAGDQTPTPVASGAVSVDLATSGGAVTERTETVCRALLATLPKKLGEHPRRPVAPASAAERTAAWGDPPIVLRCGVGVPATERGNGGQVLDYNGVSWLYQETSDHNLVMRAIDREVAVELDIPAEYSGSPASLLRGLTTPIAATVPRVNN